jgi:hypothetical protein
MSKLPGFLKDNKLESYTHLKAETNLDFSPGQACVPSLIASPTSS